jgi:hypothetical protein
MERASSNQNSITAPQGGWRRSSGIVKFWT